MRAEQPKGWERSQKAGREIEEKMGRLEAWESRAMAAFGGLAIKLSIRTVRANLEHCNRNPPVEADYLHNVANRV